MFCLLDCQKVTAPWRTEPVPLSPAHWLLTAWPRLLKRMGILKSCHTKCKSCRQNSHKIESWIENRPLPKLSGGGRTTNAKVVECRVDKDEEKQEGNHKFSEPQTLLPFDLEKENLGSLVSLFWRGFLWRRLRLDMRADKLPSVTLV